MSDRFEIPAGTAPDRNAARCRSCGDAVDAPHGPFGATIVTEFIRQHRCTPDKEPR